MPTRPGHPCAVTGCPEVVRGGRYCPVHKAERGAQYDRARGSSSTRGYGYRWQKIRALHLASQPLCVDPFGDHSGQVILGTQVDHIKPLKEGGTNDPENLQTLCDHCHSKKTAAEDGRWGKGG